MVFFEWLYLMGKRDLQYRGFRDERLGSRSVNFVQDKLERHVGTLRD